MGPKQVHACCVPSCANRESKRHRIPKDRRSCAIWLQRINNPKLNGSDKLSSYFICEEHFHPMCIEKSGRLRRYSLPTINLPSILAMAKTPSVLFGDSVQKMEVSVPKKVYGKSRAVPADENVQPGPSTAGTQLDVLACNKGFVDRPETPGNPIASTSSVAPAPELDPKLETATPSERHPRVNYNWVMEAEGKLASAAVTIADASKIMAEATRTMAEAFVRHERVASDLSANISQLLDKLLDR
nr:unnamed protein product [Callosobruchus chinensis]